MTRLEANDEANEASWAELPELADFQTLGDRKPGAEVLLEAEFGGRTQPLLVHQRYGLGNAYVLATGGTWRWQMQLPHEDQRHETFWRQFLQAAATTAPQPGDPDVGARVLRRREHRPAARRGPRQVVSAREQRRRDARGQRRNGAADERRDTPVAGERGLYEAAYETTHTGVFRFEAVAKTAGDAGLDAGGGATPGAGDELGRARFAVRRDSVVEHYRVQQNRALLERLAAATGGSYFAVGDVSRLPEAVSFSEAGSVERQVLELWNIPLAFLVLLLLKAGEWLVRLYWGRL